MLMGCSEAMLFIFTRCEFSWRDHLFIENRDPVFLIWPLGAPKWLPASYLSSLRSEGTKPWENTAFSFSFVA